MSFIIVFCYLVVTSHAQDLSTSEACKKYESQNWVDYELKVTQIKGQILDGFSARVSQGCLSLFTEDTHKLIVTITADDDGFFKFDKIPMGRYRLVVRDPEKAFCPANAIIKIVKWRLGRNSLVVRLVPRSTDVCSEIKYKK